MRRKQEADLNKQTNKQTKKQICRGEIPGLPGDYKPNSNPDLRTSHPLSDPIWRTGVGNSKKFGWRARQGGIRVELDA